MKYFEAHDITEYRDINGNIPEILIVDGNRSAGKTTGFSKKLVDDFLNQNKKFMLIYRYMNELTNISESFFKDIRSLFFPDHEMTEKKKANATYTELYLDGTACGYAVALNSAGKLKHYSHVFSDVQQMFFDEYQLENGFYIPDEIKRFVSLHMTVARGQGKVVRFVPVYMCSNSISIFNPYYEAFQIAGKINSKTKVLKGDGFVLLRLTMKEVAQEQEKSAFNRAFAGSGYIKSAVDNSFLNDESYNIIKEDLKYFQPVLVYKYHDVLYTLYSNGYKMHVKAGDCNTVQRYGATQQDRGENYNSIRNSGIYSRIRLYYSDGNLTFQTPDAKRSFLELLFS